MLDKILMKSLKANIKPSKKEDLLIIKLPKPSFSSFLFTTNHFLAGSVIYTKKVYEKNPYVSVLVINSGNANCGIKESVYHSELICEAVSKKLNVPKEEIYFFSTGIIGEALPIEEIIKAIEKIENLEPFDIELASKTISTTDAFPKYVTKENSFGFAKGAGMINPSMATMLSFCFTNAKLQKEVLKDVHKDITERTFNAITVDNCQSTNDSFGIITLSEKHIELEDVKKELFDISKSLAKMIVKDGEGSNKIIKVLVKNASSKEKAKAISKAIGSSLLLKTAIYGGDPNWGRIAAAAGSTEFFIDQNSIQIKILDTVVYDKTGLNFDKKALSQKIKERDEISIELDLREGEFCFESFSSSIGYEYIKINAEYTT